jgi:hypothetical protein
MVTSPQDRKTGFEVIIGRRDTLLIADAKW